MRGCLNYSEVSLLQATQKSAASKSRENVRNSFIRAEALMDE